MQQVGGNAENRGLLHAQKRSPPYKSNRITWVQFKLFKLCSFGQESPFPAAKRERDANFVVVPEKMVWASLGPSRSPERAIVFPY